MEKKSDNILTMGPQKPKGLGIRHIQAALLFLGLSFSVALRTNLSVGIVAMTDKSSDSYFEVFDWSSDTKGLLLSSFFWGYIVMQIPAGLLAHLFGAKILFLVSIFGASLFTVIIPALAPLGWGYVCATRVINGLFQGCVYPCLYTLMAKWVHPSERALTTVIMTGNSFGIFFMMIISGDIAASPLGWPGIFYISGGLGFLWCALWLWIGSDSPAKNKRISTEERRYIQETTGTTSHEALPIPWLQILTSVPFIAAVFDHCSINWGYYTLMTETPAYIKDILKFDIKQSAILAAMPYLVLVIACLLIAPLSDFLTNRNYLTRTNSQKLFNSLGQWAPAICLIVLAFLGQESGPEVAITLLILAVGFYSGCHAGFLLNYINLSPNFSGTLYAMSNCISQVFSFLAPMFVGFIVSDPKDPELWKIVFLVAAGFNFLGNLIFVLFGKAVIQKWNVGRMSLR